MKRIKIIFLPLILLLGQSLMSAREKTVEEEPDLYEYNNIVASLSKASSPEIADDYIIFTQPTGPRYVGIAFDYENYSKIHSFEIHRNYDFEGNVTSSVMFYLLKRPEELSSLTYRLIIDGLWTPDPLNDQTCYDENTGITLSHLEIGDQKPQITKIEKNNLVKFIYRGESGQEVRLGGNFTNWDSWIYELNETSPGFYELEIALPEGKYYYNYFLGMNTITDKTNPEKEWGNDGTAHSVLYVN